MEYVFITPSGTLQDCWQDAFPRARAVCSAGEVTAPENAGGGALWLDALACSGKSGLRQLRETVALGRPVVVLAATLDEAEALRVLAAGAVGYGLATTAPRQFWEIALVVEHGGLWVAPELRQRVLALQSSIRCSGRPVGTDLTELTARELMVAEQVARGATNREIAGVLAITERTVKAHLSAVFEKLGVRDRVQLALTMHDLPSGTTVS